MAFPSRSIACAHQNLNNLVPHVAFTKIVCTMSKSLSLRVRRELLEPQFEGYKLSLQATPTFVTELAINNKSDVGNKLNFIKNVLIVDHFNVDQVYFVHEGQVQKVEWDEEQRSIDTVTVADFDFKRTTEKNVNLGPSLVFASDNFALVSDGQGEIFFYETGCRKERGKKWTLITRHKDFFDDENGSFVIASAKVIKEAVHVALLHLDEGTSASEEKLDNPMKIVTRAVLRKSEGNEWKITLEGEKLFFRGDLDHIDVLDEDNVAVVTNNKFGTKSSLNSSQNGQQKEVGSDHEGTLEGNDIPSVFWSQGEDDLTIYVPISEYGNASKEDVSVGATSDKLKICVKDKVLIDCELCLPFDPSTLTWSLVSENRILEISLEKKEEVEWWKLVEDPRERYSELEVPRDSTNAATIAKLCYKKDTLATSTLNPGHLEECDANPEAEPQLLILSLKGDVKQRLSLLGHQWLFSLGNGCFCIRHDVDGLVWKLSNEELQHVATFNALGYVQASKNSRKFTVCPSDHSYAAIVDSFRHIYVYHQPSILNSELRNRKSGQRVSHVAKQQVITVDSNEEMIGVAALDRAILILTQSQLRLIKFVP